MKRCSLCLEYKPPEAFARDRSRTNGRMARCKACDAERARRYYGSNGEAVRDRVKARNTAQRSSLPPRVCKDCPRLAVSRRHWYCQVCGERHRKLRGKKARDKTPGKTTKRGYGSAHQRLRERWAPLVARGEVACHRPDCGRLIYPGEPWDLGHDDNDRSKYTGPEHRKCNRRAAAIKGNAQRAGQPSPPVLASAGSRLPGW